jgi:hypothetical protein
MRIILLLASLAVLASCDLSDDDEISGPAVAVPGCGPTDTPVLDIYVAPEDISCDYHIWASPQRIPYIHITVDGSIDLDVPSSFAIGDSVETRAESCTATLDCTEAVSGSVSFHRSAGEALTSLTYDLRFAGGSTSAATIKIRRCAPRFVCG